MAGPVPVALTRPASHGVELVNASALLLLLLLNLLLIGRQDRLKRREVERRLRGIIDQIQGEPRVSHAGGEAVLCRLSARRTRVPNTGPQALPLVGIPGAPGIGQSAG